MKKAKVRISKTIQETKYEPFTVDVELESDADPIGFLIETAIVIIDDTIDQRLENPPNYVEDED